MSPHPHPTSPSASPQLSSVHWLSRPSSPLFLALSLSVLALTIPLYRLLDAERTNVGAVPRAIHTEGEATREWLRLNALPIIANVSGNADARTRDLTTSAQTLLANLNGAIVQVVGPNGQLTSLRSDLLSIANTLTSQTGTVVTTIADIKRDLSPTLANINSASAELPPAIRDARFLLARGARATGHIEQTLDKVESAVPQLLANADSITLNVAHATDESAKTAEQSRLFMSHLAEATKPLPSWARIALAVAPPVVQTGFTVGSWMALKGKTK